MWWTVINLNLGVEDILAVLISASYGNEPISFNVMVFKGRQLEFRHSDVLVIDRAFLFLKDFSKLAGGLALGDDVVK